MNRILTWHQQERVGNSTRIGPTYYVDVDSEPVDVRVHAETSPVRDAEVDIFDDGVSIFANHAAGTYDEATGWNTPTPETEASLSLGQTAEELAGDFNGNVIEAGSWVHCQLVDAGGGRNFSVHLELRPVSEADAED